MKKVFSILLGFLLMVQLAFATKFDEIKLSSGAYKITDKNYEKILSEYRQDYTVVLFLTAIAPNVGCSLCRELAPVYDTIANSYKTNLQARGIADDEKVLFAISDVQDSLKLFRLYELNNVPKIYILKKGSNSIAPDFEYGFTTGDHIEGLTSWVMKSLPTLDRNLLRIIQQTDYSAVIINVLGVAIFTFTVYYHRKKFAALVSKPTGWQSFSIVVIILFTTGYMYNVIRNTPYSRQGNDGSIVYISPGQQSQYGAETQILSVIYGALTIALILLLEKIPQIKRPGLKFVATMTAIVAISFIFNMLVVIFREKSRGYPLQLFS